MSETLLLRGRALDFARKPESHDDLAAARFIEDAGILVKDGLIAAIGDYVTIAKQAPDGTQTVDHRPHLLMPGFIDPHLHFVQMQVIASFGTQLLEWLNRYTFPEEMRFADPAHGARIASAFFDEMIRHGTTTAAAYCSAHPASVEAFFAESHRRNMRMIAGRVMMDRNAPDGLIDTAQSSYDDTKALIGRWHGKGRQHYAVTPRFAITSTPAQMDAAGALAAEHPDCFVQTHLSENHDEIAYACSLFPDAANYTDIYAHYGLLGPKSLLGHCIHLSEAERDMLADTRSVAVFCPTSNLFLGSGLFDWQGLETRADPVRIAIATDIGGGTNYSMLRTLDEGYKALQLRRQTLPPLKAFWQITRGNAEALGLEAHIGTLQAGSEADIVVLNAAATPAMALRRERIETLSEELFLLQTLGDDRAVAETYVAGRGMKGAVA